MGAIYNEIEPFACAWLRNLIAGGHIADGVVDGRSICDLAPADVAGPGQRHFFSGIAGWSHALRLAGVPDDADVWTGSCPCQPFSVAGKGNGVDDDRHLWPVWFELIRECRPRLIFGEQVASRAVTGGRPVEAADVQGVLDREAVVDVLREFKGQALDDVHRMHEVCAAESAETEGREVGGPCEVEGIETRPCASGGGQTQGEGSRLGVRPGRGRHPEAGRRRSVRDDRDPVQPDDAALMGRAVVGQDQPGTRLHEGQREGRALCGQCDGERVGREPNRSDRGRHSTEEKQSLCGLINEARGETQGEAARPWLDIVRTDLERIGYAVGLAVLPAAGVGAPHIRERVFFGAVRLADGDKTRSVDRQGTDRARIFSEPGHGSRLGDADSEHAGRDGGGARRAEAASEGCRGVDGRNGYEPRAPGRTRGPWDDAEWIVCTDGKARPAQPGSFPLADGVPARVGKLRAYGNAIVPEVAAEFIGAFLDAVSEQRRAA